MRKTGKEAEDKINENIVAKRKNRKLVGRKKNRSKVWSLSAKRKKEKEICEEGDK